MTFKTITQQRDEKRIFAGNDTAHILPRAVTGLRPLLQR